MTGLLILFAYFALFTVGWLAVRTIRNAMAPVDDFNARKTVTFGDESAVTPDRWT